MLTAARSPQPEQLDELAPDDPRAIRARIDLQRLHHVLGSVGILRRAWADLLLDGPPRRLLELGAGDGTLLLRMLETVDADWSALEVTLLDRVDVVAAATRERYARLGIALRVERTDVLDWAEATQLARYDVCLASLFLHHFEPSALGRLLPAIARRARAFVACEPRRGAIAQLGSRLVGLLGAGAVTRADAVSSVAAGFTGAELSSCWTAHVGGHWSLDEFPAGLFAHCFMARRLDGGAQARDAL